MQHSVNQKVAQPLNDLDLSRSLELRMVQPTRIHEDEPYGFQHFIPDWAARARLRQVDLVKLTGADKSLVSRWFGGMRPGDEYLALVAKAVNAPEIASLFRHPDDDWISRFFKDRTEEERRRMIQTLEAAFPRKTA